MTLEQLKTQLEDHQIWSKKDWLMNDINLLDEYGRDTTWQWDIPIWSEQFKAFIIATQEGRVILADNKSLPNRPHTLRIKTAKI